MSKANNKEEFSKMNINWEITTYGKLLKLYLRRWMYGIYRRSFSKVQKR